MYNTRNATLRKLFFNIRFHFSHLEPTYGDVEYLAAFRTIVLPIVKEYKPDIILVSAGFDAADGHNPQLGGYAVSAACKYLSLAFAFVFVHCISIYFGLPLCEESYVFRHVCALVSASLSFLGIGSLDFSGFQHEVKDPQEGEGVV